MKKKTLNSSRGGGYKLNSRPSIFKPIIASSLALALGVSVGSAECTVSNNDKPVFCVDGNVVSNRFTDPNNGGEAKSWQDRWSVSGNVANFDQNTLLIDLKKGNNTISFNGWGTVVGHGESVLNSGTNGISINGGTGTLQVNFINTSAAGNLTLDLSKATSDYSFMGNIQIVAGRDKTFTGNFAKNFKGNVTLTNNRGHYAATTKLNFGTANDVKNQAQSPSISETNRLEGDISVTTGNLVINFNQNGEIQGNIIEHFTTKGAYGLTRIAFQKSGKITGDISTEARTTTVIFQNAGEIQGNIIDNSAYQFQKYATNNITFSGTGTNTITGNITANGGTNTINFSGTGTNQITGNINANAGTNTITFGTNGSGTSETTASYQVDTNTGSSTITGDITANGGTNTIIFNNAGTINGIITAGANGNVATNTITFSGNATIGSTSVGAALTSSPSTSSLIANNRDNGNTPKTNTLTFKGTGTNSVTFNEVKTLGHGNTKNILIFSGSGTNTLTIQNGITSEGGVNSIGKEDLSTVRENGFAFSPVSSKNTYQRGVNTQQRNGSDIASKAMVGTLTINGGIAGSNSGWSNIAFKISSNSQTAPVIQKLREVVQEPQSPEVISPSQKTLHFQENGKTYELDTAISGNANIYLDLNAVTPTLDLTKLTDDATVKTALSKSAILGHITPNGGTQNIYIKGKGESNKLTVGLTGNINNTNDWNSQNGTMNIIFEDSFWTPYAAMTVNADMTPTEKATALSGLLTNAGGIVTTNGTKTNIVLRKTSNTTPAGSVGLAQTGSPLSMPVYKVNSIKGETNIVMQGDIAASSYISYTNGGSVNLIFANSNDGAADSYASGNTNVSQNKILGKTYKDGVKLALQDKKISIGDQQNVSFLNTYGHYFSTNDEGSLLSVTTTRVTTPAKQKDGTTKHQTDHVYIKGLALGNISALASSNGSAAKNGTTYDYRVVLGAHSAFVGDMKLQEGSVINLIMEDSSKLLTDVEHLKLKTLTLKSSGYNTNEMLLDTFAQNNTIIDIATMGDALGNLKERSAFRLLEIGEATAGVGVGAPGVAGYVAAAQPSGGSGASGAKGLQGSGALFRVYVNANAQQDQAAANARQGAGVQADVRNATLGGNSSNGGASGQYGYVYSDRIIIHDGSTTITNGQLGQQTQQNQDNKVNYIQTIYDANTDINKLTYHGGGSETEGNIAVATVKTSSNIKFEGATQIQGFDEVGTTLTSQTTDQYGKVNQTTVGAGEKQASNIAVSGVEASAAASESASTNDYTTYFISSVESKGASVANQLATATALGLNYELFLANFNSLNKRMGELRNNDNGQGAWGRIFNGMLTTSYGLEAKSVYTTIQAGYDYAFGFEGANNYLGVALSYANSIIKPKGITDIDGYSKGIDKSISNAVELAVYNSYVEDSGWFNDTIFKFSYIMSSINMSGQSSEYDTNNYGIVFSDEFGYRFKLGNDQEWYIDPQLELSFGYFNQSDLKQVLGEASLTGVQDSIINLRSRVGVNWAYDFKRFTQGKGIKASVYLGTYYAYDYIEGGDISLMTNLGKGVNLQALASTGRFEMNIGTNVEIKDNTRLYFDFERSFGGDITTEYQINLGVRYSFGESNGYTPINTQAIKLEKAPLKVEESTQEQVENSKANQAQEQVSNNQEEVKEDTSKEDAPKQEQTQTSKN